MRNFNIYFSSDELLILNNTFYNKRAQNSLKSK